MKGEPVKKAEQLVTEGIARWRIIDKLLTDAPTLIVLKPGEILMPNPRAVEMIQLGYARRKAREARQKVIDQLLKNAQRRKL